jgi:sugar diacid utilization regulator
MLNVPSLSPALRENTLLLASRFSSVNEQVLLTLLKMKEYAELAPVVRQDVIDCINFSARLWFQCMLSGMPPTSEDLLIFQAFGKRRVHQGVPLSALLRSFRLGSLELWRQYIAMAQRNDALREELLLQISPYLLEYFDEMAQLFSQAFLNEQYEQSRWRESLRHQLNSIIFNYPEDTESFNKTAAALRLDPSLPRIALALELAGLDNNSPSFESLLDQMVMCLSRHLQTPADDVVSAWHRGRLIVWVPSIRGNLMNANDRLIAGQVATLKEDLPELAMIGIGLTGQGAKGWSVSAQEALRALDDGQRCGGDQGYYLYSDIVIEESVRGTGSILRYLVSLIEQLSHEPDLLLTLETYFNHGQRRKVTAEALNIHPNTLNYRLERIEKLLGARLDNVAWMTKLHVAISLYKDQSVFHRHSE